MARSKFRSISACSARTLASSASTAARLLFVKWLYPEHGGVVRDAPNDEVRNGHDAPEIVELRARLADAHETIRDLRQRLDTEAEERRRLTALLADQRPSAPPAPPRRSWLP